MFSIKEVKERSLTVLQHPLLASGSSSSSCVHSPQKTTELEVGHEGNITAFVHTDSVLRFPVAQYKLGEEIEETATNIQEVLTDYVFKQHPKTSIIPTKENLDKLKIINNITNLIELTSLSKNNSILENISSSVKELVEKISKNFDKQNTSDGNHKKMKVQKRNFK
jgi:hypothetical protein